MRTSRALTAGAVALTGALALSACGSDNNSGGASRLRRRSRDRRHPRPPRPTASPARSAAKARPPRRTPSRRPSRRTRTACSDATINYNATGSGAGIKQFTGKQVDFAGSDSALKTDEATAAKTSCGSDAWNLPMVAGPIAIAYNVKGVTNLVLNADVAAKIFNGVITTWNDPAIAALNSGATLPATPIKVFFRSDESGTTENFTNYLKAAAPAAWTAAPAKKWTGKGEGKEKSAGVSSAVASTDGGITYTEWSYATQNKLAMAKIDNGSGTPVELTGETAGKMVAGATQVGTGNDLSLKLDYATKAAGTYPIVLVTYNIVCSKYADSAKGKAVKGFLSSFASDSTQSGLEELGYAPLPKEVQTKVVTAVNAVS